MKPLVHREPPKQDEGDTWKTYLGSLDKGLSQHLAERLREIWMYLEAENTGLTITDILDIHPAVLVAAVHGERGLSRKAKGGYVLEVNGVVDPKTGEDKRSTWLVERQGWAGSRKSARESGGDRGE